MQGTRLNFKIGFGNSPLHWKMEEETWRIFQVRANLDDASLPLIEQVYFEKMKRVVSEKQLAA